MVEDPVRGNFHAGAAQWLIGSGRNEALRAAAIASQMRFARDRTTTRKMPALKTA